MLRHTALFLHRDTAGEDQKLRLLRSAAFLRMECAGVCAGDYGDDLFGGSTPLGEVPPWKRTPRWRARSEGPACNYDVALHLDFTDEDAAARCFAGERYRAVAEWQRSATVPEFTACVDWRYDGAPLVRRGSVRHTAMFVWADEADGGARSRAVAAARSLTDVPGVISAATGDNAGARRANFDWLLDVQLHDVEAARRMLDGTDYAAAMRVIAATTKYEWTARVTHVMRGY